MLHKRENSTTTELPPLPEHLEDRLADCGTLPSLPAAVARVLSLARHPNASLQDYARAIEEDPALTLRLLSLANSVFYSRRNIESHTCQEAVSRLGLDTTLAAVMSFGLAKTSMDDLPLDHLWRRTIVAALAARHMANHLCPEKTGMLFTTALLQDIGILAAISLDENGYHQQIRDTDGHDDLVAAEEILYGCDHARIGGWLAAKWGLPLHLVQGIINSHGELIIDDPDILCLRLSGPIADAWLSPAPPEALSRLLDRFAVLSETYPLSLVNLLDEVQDQLPSMASLLEITSVPPCDNQALLEEAKEHLFHQTLALTARVATHDSEIQNLHRRQTELEQRTRRDTLTGLANRAWLEEQLKEAFQLCQVQQRTLSILFIDLDHFKKLNDRHGHQLGDRVLERFAVALQESVREGDLAGRYGGEEFLVILPDESTKGARATANRLEKRLAEHPLAHVGGKPLHVTVSIGIACLGDGDFNNTRELIDAADQNMYRVKRSSRGG